MEVSEPRGWRQTLSSLSNRDFRFLLLSTVFMMSAWGMQMVVVSYLAYDLTSSPFKLGIVQSGYAPSLLACSLFGGAIADRWNRKRIIMVGQGIAATASLLVAIVVITGQINWVHLLMLSVFEGAWFSFIWPARQSIIPGIVGRERLTNAIALNGAAMAASFLFVPGIAGAIYGLVGPEGVFFTDAGLGVMAALMMIYVPNVKSSSRESKTSTLRDIGGGLAYIWRSRLVLTLLVVAAAISLFAMPLRQLLPVLIVDIYQRGPESLGFMLSMGGAGSLVGAVIIASLGTGRRGKLLLLAAFASGTGLMLIAVVPVYFAAVGFMALMGLGDSGTFTLFQAIIMDQVDDEFRGRVMSVWMLNFSLVPLGVLPAGLIAQYYGGQVAAGVLATLVLLTGLVMLTTQRRVWEIR